jgi:toxin ParE1/3/4
MTQIYWTELARYDLQSIHDFISKDSPFYADKFIERLIERTGQLEQFPESGRVVPEFNNETIREIIEGNYRIVYRTRPGNVTIIRIHHAARMLQ